jgi:hypothetical protein
MMATLQQFSDDDQDEGANPTAPSDNGADEQDDSKLDGGNPAHAIGWIPSNASPKVKTFLLAAKQFLINSPGASDRLKKLLGSSKDHVTALAMLVGHTIQSLEQKLGPLSDPEQQQVSMVITGWLVSSLQALGMPGLDTPQGRHDLMGRVLQKLDAMSSGQGQPPAEGTLPQMQPGGDEAEPVDNPAEEQQEGA